MSDKRLFLLDGHALVYRAHFAFIARPLINSKGLNTSAINGFTRTLWDILKKDKPTHIAVAFDPPGPTFRHEQYELYKANREEQPDDIKTALPYIKKIVEAFHIPIIMMDGYEADDVIGTIAKQAENQGYQVYMVTPDKDYAQLVTSNIFMYKPSRQGNGIEVLGLKEILENWQIERAEQVIDLLGLQGDAVDNIPGIPGIGPKTAVKLIQEYGSVEELIRNKHKVEGKIKEKIEAFAEQAMLSKDLATINCQVPILFDAGSFTLDPPNKVALSELFKELEFRSLAKSILEEEVIKPIQGSLFDQEEAGQGEVHRIAENNISNSPHQYHVIEGEEAMLVLAEKLKTNGRFSFDTETTDIDPMVAKIVGVSFSIQEGEAYYLPLTDKTSLDRFIHIFSSLFESSAIQKIAQNFKYDALIFKNLGIDIRGYVFDTMLAHYLLEPDLRHSMDYMAETYLSYKPIPITDLIGSKGKGQLNMKDISIEKIAEYAAEDADITWRLYQYLQPRLRDEGLEELYKKIEEPLSYVLTDMEYEGINLDSKVLNQYAIELTEHIREKEEQIIERAGVSFNIASPKQVGEVLFDKLQIPYRWSKTKSGQYSTNEEKLSEIKMDHPIIEDILTHRGLTKLLTTYVEALPKMVNPNTGRIHTSFNQALAATGRLSSNQPNLQNIPIRTMEGAKVREAFIPRDNHHVLLSADYSQIELRLIAEISGDEAMLESFLDNKDVHRATAAKVFGVSYDEVSKEQRYRAKTVNFSIIYGAGATNLSRQLGIKRSEATELIQQYFKQYTGIKNYMETVVLTAREQGYVTTLMGRRRYLRDINSKSSLEKSLAERMAINTPIQGSAADLIKLAMIAIHRYILENGLKSRMILQVHDELIFDVPREELELIKPAIKKLMENAMSGLRVPILVEMGEGNNWREAH
jgi:DNA polymerase I